MVDWTTVLVSMLGSIGTSGLASWFLIGTRIKKEQQYERKVQRENWYHQVNSICHRIWRVILETPYEVPIDPDTKMPTGSEEGSEQMNKLQPLIQELLKTHTEAPAEVDKELLKQIEAMGYWFDNMEYNEVTTTTDVRRHIRSKVEGIMDKITTESERFERPPYR